MMKSILLGIFGLNIVTASSAASVPTCPLDGNWNYVATFSDEFDATCLNTNMWWDFNPAWIGRKPALFSRDNVSVSDGCLRLVARTPSPESVRYEDQVRGYGRYTTATVKSRQRIRYGYFETRAKVMKANVCNAFWLYDPLEPSEKYRSGSFSEEIDVFEIFGNAKTSADVRTLHTTVHRTPTPYVESIVNLPQPYLPDKTGSHKVDFNFYDAFHRFGLLWTPTEIRWYLDGKVIFSRENDHFIRPLHIIFDCEIMQKWVGLPDDTELPATFEVDYLRVWQTPEQARMWQTSSGEPIDPEVREQALHFIRNETQFHLGYLPTEQSHPQTRGLSQALQTDTAKGIAMLLRVDDDIPPVMEKTLASPEFVKLRNAIQTALDHGNRIYFSGCGATGRLAILLDAAHRRFCRETAARHPAWAKHLQGLAEQTCAVMTGGDFALIKSVEMFEDYITFGHQQLLEAGIKAGDVLIAISEGGETSSVIGTIGRGVEVGAQVFFLFNNPPELLSSKLDRCRTVMQDKRVTLLPLCTGPMGIAGSTRMQATTTELLIAGSAFESALIGHLSSCMPSGPIDGSAWTGCTPLQTLADFRRLLQQLRTHQNILAMAAMTDSEAALYSRQGRVTYFANDYLLDIFTDTTERSPTFKIPPFRRPDETNAPSSWAFVKDPLRSTQEAWSRLLEHPPRCLDWSSDLYIRLGASEKIRMNPPRIDVTILQAYRIGNEADPLRTDVSNNVATAILLAEEATFLDTTNAWRTAFDACAKPFAKKNALVISPRKPASQNVSLFHVQVDVPQTPLHLFEHLSAKLVLNTISSATMGKMGRLSGNWMAHVDASNKKLIDRSVRLIAELAEVDYETACIALFQSLKEMSTWDEARKKTTSPAAYTVQRLTQKPLSNKPQ